MSARRENDEKDERRHYPSVFWPVLLIVAGVLFLLDNLGYVDISWGEVWRLWPVLLILAGLDLLFARRSALGTVLMLILTLALIGGVVWLVVSGAGLLAGDDRGDAADMSIAEELRDVESAALEVRAAAGELNLRRLDDGDKLIEGRLELASSRQPEWTIDRSDGKAMMKLAYGSGEGPISVGLGDREAWTLELSPDVAYDLVAALGAGTSHLDLTGLDLRSLTVEAGAGQATVILPERGDMQASVRTGVGSVTIQIPTSVAVKLHIERALVPLSLPKRFQKDGDDYIAGNWETADNRVELQLNLAIGALTIEDR